MQNIFKYLAPISALLLITGTALADRITLKDGTVFEGRILAENAFEMQFEVARNKTGSIKTVLLIDHKEVEGIQRTTPKAHLVDYSKGFNPGAASSNEEEKDAVRDAPAVNLRAYERKLQLTTGLVAKGNYDEAITNYTLVAKDPGLIKMLEKTPEDAIASLEMQSRAYRLWSIALEGKAEMMEEQADQSEEVVEDKIERIKDKIALLKDRVEEEKKPLPGLKNTRESDSNFRTRADSLPAGQGKFEKIKQQLEKRIAQLNQNLVAIGQSRVEIKNIEAEVELLEEKTKQIKKTLSGLQKSRRSSRR